MRDIVRSKKEIELVRVKIHDGNAFWNEIGVNAGVSKLMLLSLNLLLPVLVYAVRHSLTVVRHKLMLPGITSYCWMQVLSVMHNSESNYYTLCIKLFWATTRLQPGNEFSSTMASAIICLATTKKFNFSKYIFDNMVKNLEGGVKFLMYPRFVQVFLDNQVEGMTKHKGIYVTPSHTKKVFANMKRPGKGFSGKVAPLFQTMMVQAREDMDVLDLEEAKTAQAKEIASLKKRVKQLEKIRKSRTSGLKRRCIQTGRKIADSCADAESDLIDEANERNDGKRCCFDVQRCFKVKKKVVDEKGKTLGEEKKHFAALRAQEKSNQLKGRSYEEIQKLFDKAYKQVNSFVPMDAELVKSSVTRTEGSSKRAGDELESNKSKKQKIDEHVEAEKDDDQEEAEMKKHIEIVKDDE
ncbi:hypothetical protein Tco_0316778 [Tanacetum coccineum]